MRHLDDHLLELERRSRAPAAGPLGARRRRGNRIVGDLIVATGADEVVKVKSMATDEIG
jgi:L-lactate dehydrogenase complex protein LldF